MVEESTRRLPRWMMGDGDRKERKKEKTDLPPTSTRKRKKSKEIEELANKKKKNSKPSSPPAELTVEDLVSIAEEYVKAEKDQNQKWSSHGALESQTQVPSTASDDETTSSTVSLGGADQSLMTGNPAQDMLDLFLGPLLKKAIQ